MKGRIVKVSENGKKRSKKLRDMSVEDFMNSFGESGSDSSSSVGEDERDDTPSHKTLVEESGIEQDGSEEGSEESEEAGSVSGEESAGENERDIDDEDASDAGSSSDDKDLDSVHKKSLHKLRELDPEFYKYLEENDKKLLQFNVSDSDDSGSEDELVHRPPDKLEGGSDESDDDLNEEDSGKEDEGDSPIGGAGNVVTLKMVQKWREKLQTDKSVETIGYVVQAFHAALLRVGSEEERADCLFQVEGGSVFNAVVQMCVLDLLPAIRKYLKIPGSSLSYTNPTKCKHWPKIKTLLRSYVADLLQLLGGIASVNISTILLKHIHQMTPFIICFPNVLKHFLKRMISLWSNGEETVQIVAFMCILRATSLQQRALLDQVLRQMYLAYVKNTKFISPNTLPGISFMRRSLTEIFLLDENVSYHHAFLYIRQLAIHLRNAITIQNKESIQAVCNWQFVSSLALWSELLGTSSKQALEPLLYPIVQIITGLIKLLPTAQYYPLRFHCVRLLINLSRNSGTFIPVLPFLLEILNSFDFNKKHTKVSMKPMDFSCILRLSKIQQQENGFKDAVVENIYTLALEYLSNESQSIAFPDLSLPFMIQMKDFLKKCKVANYTKKFKQILEKVEENSKFIECERKGAVLKLSDAKAIENWETAVKVKGTPLGTFFSSWVKMNATKQAKAKREEIDISENLPKIIRPSKKKTTSEGPVELLPSDDSDSDGIGFGDEEEQPVERKRGKRGKRLSKQPSQKRMKISEESFDDNGIDDVVEDVNLADW